MHYTLKRIWSKWSCLHLMYCLGSCWTRLDKITKILTYFRAGIPAGHVPIRSQKSYGCRHLIWRRSTSSRLLWNAAVHWRIRNSARMTLLCMSHMTKIHRFTSYFLIISVNIVPLSSLRFWSRIFLSIPTPHPPRKNFSTHFYSLMCMLHDPPTSPSLMRSPQ